MHREESVFPFSAVVGQEQVKLALLLSAVDHRTGGVLVRGRRGTAKSTLARALAHLLPEIEVVSDCPFSCDPRDIESLCGYCAGNLALEGSLSTTRSRMRIVTLPLNATEEMVVGTLDIEKALRHGERSFDPGILARANRGILYVDEVNLLEDHIVDILLDSAAMGVNVVEREGVSFRHGARFILVGTMNPEEGDLRPQLEDRFGLCADVDPGSDAAERAEVLKRNLQFGRNPLEFEAAWNAQQEELREKIVAARGRCADVEVPEQILAAIGTVVERAGADGHRADLAMLHSARALAALEERDRVEAGDVARVAGLALSHRLRRGPLGMEDGRELDLTSLTRGLAAEEQDELPGFEQSADGVPDVRSPAPVVSEEQAAGDTPPFEQVSIPEARQGGESPGKRRANAPDASRGRYYRSASPAVTARVSPSDIALDATLRASAARGPSAEGRPEVLPEDVRVKVRRRKSGATILFVVDASASMGAARRLEASREAILELLVDAYRNRDRVGLVVFKDDSAQLVMSPTSSPALAGRLLGELTAGGATPLSHGLALANRVLDRELAREPRPVPVMVLLSDGGGNVAMGSSDPIAEAVAIARDIRERGITSVVLDSAPRTEGSPFSSMPTAAKRIADALGGAYFPARNVSSGSIVEKVVATAGREPAGNLPSSA